MSCSARAAEKLERRARRGDRGTQERLTPQKNDHNTRQAGVIDRQINGSSGLNFILVVHGVSWSLIVACVTPARKYKE